MTVPPVRINPAGGSIRLAVTFKSAQVVTYSIFLWEQGNNSEVGCFRGNNQNPEDDEFALPMPASSNLGRLLEADVSLIDPDPKSRLTKTYHVEITVSQDGVVLHTIVMKGKMSGTRDQAGGACTFTT